MGHSFDQTLKDVEKFYRDTAAIDMSYEYGKSFKPQGKK